MDTKQYYQLVADILSLQSSDESLELSLKNPNINWETFVYHTTNHFVLPAIYCRLKHRQMLQYVPDDLVTYMQQFTTINRNRNDAILKQMKALSALLDEHHIDYVYVKGAAMIAGDYYEDITERMVGDIDILIDEKYFVDVYYLLKKNNYEENENGRKFSLQRATGKHMPKMVTPTEIAAVEIHRWLYNKRRQKLIDENDVLKGKRKFNDFSIPSTKHMLHHNIFNWQINDNGHTKKEISFRAIYDTLLILKKDNTEKLLPKNNYVTSYLSMGSLLFADFKSTTTYSSVIYKLKLQSHWFSTYYPKINTFLLSLKNRLVYVKKNIYLLSTSKFYRKKGKIILLRKLRS